MGKTAVALAALGAALCLRAAEPAGPVFGEARLFDATGRDAMALDLEGHYLYGGAGDWFVVFDVADPLNPRKVGAIRGIGAARQLVVQKGMAYVSTREYGVWIVDATDPAKPRIRSRFDCCELATGIDVAGDVCFCGQRQNGVEFIDVRDPDHPRHIAMRKTGESQSVLYRDGYLYSGEWGDGNVTVFDARDMRSIRQVALIDLYGYGDGLWAQGKYLFAPRGHHALHRQVTGGIKVSADDIRTSGSPTTGLGMGHGLDVFDITDPVRPARVGTVDFPPLYIRGLDMWTSRTSGDLLVAAQTHDGLIAVDISDKAHPKVLERWLSPKVDPYLKRKAKDCPSDCVGAVAIGNGAVYAAVKGEGFFVFPCERAKAEPLARGVLPQHAEFREPYPTDEKVWHVWRPHDVGQVRGVALKGDTAYVACGDAGLYVLDVLPQDAGWREVAKVGGREQVYDVSVFGNRLFTAEGEKGFGVYDISEKMPKEICRLGRISDFRHLAFWVTAVNETRLLLSDRRRWILYDISRLPDFREIAELPSTCPGWDKYVTDRPIGAGYMAFNNCHRNIFWFDVRDGKVAAQTKMNFTTLMNGLCAFGKDRALFTRGRGYAVLDPLAVDGSPDPEWTLTDLPPYRGKRFSPGIPRSDGRFVAFTRRISRQVVLCDLADPAHPVMTGAWKVSGNPDVAAFHNGKAVIPCAYQGLLLQRDPSP